MRASARARSSPSRSRRRSRALHGAPFSPAAFADALDRGNRSGVGLAAFVTGGLIVDGGRDDGDAPPPVIARLPFPEAWRVVLILDSGRTGVHGAEERRAFRNSPGFPRRRRPRSAARC